MRILLTNDDGVHAPGIKALFLALKDYHEVTLIAPNINKSAASSSLTLTNPLRIEKLEENIYSLNGTPSDCARIGLEFLDNKVDMIVSGINNGENLGDDALYSGTIGAALEGRYLNKISLAISLVGTSKANYNFAADYIKDLIPKIKNLQIESKLLNINIPDINPKDIKGYKVTKLGKRLAHGFIKKSKDVADKDIYWIGAVHPNTTQDDNDFIAIQNNYISITPLQIDMTSYNSFETLKSTFEK
ncbi:MAG: 5'/3'-nucleotidase SurE [Psittacicella sp.]